MREGRDNLVTTIALNTYQMDPALVRGWGQAGFAIEPFLREFIRKQSHNGVDPNDQEAYNRLKVALTPKLLAYSPRENMWNGVFEEFKRIADSYGEYIFEDTIAEKVNTWANVLAC